MLYAYFKSFILILMLKVAVVFWFRAGVGAAIEDLPQRRSVCGGRLPFCVYDNGVRPKARLPDKTDNGHAPASCLYKDLNKVVPIYGLAIGGL